MIECYQETLGFEIEKKCSFFFRQQISISLIKLLFDLPLLHNIRPFGVGVNALNGESIIRYPFPFTFHFKRTEWQKSNETCDGY